MVRHIIKRFSRWVRHSDKIRMRQLMAVVCILILFLIFLNYDPKVEKPENSEIEASTIISDEETANNNTQLELASTSLPLAGISLYESELLQAECLEDARENNKSSVSSDATSADFQQETSTQEEATEKPERENTLYYVVDDGYEYYLDEKYQDYLYVKLKKYGMEKDWYEICIALMYHESGFETQIVSATNDHGLMQINNGNFSWLHNELNIDSLDDPYDNIDCGVYLLNYGYNKFDSVEAALVCYNMGEGNTTSSSSTKYSRCILYNDVNKLKKLEE